MDLPVDYTKLTWQERRKVREAYVIKQGGNCYHCNSPLSSQPPDNVLRLKVTKRLFPKEFFKWPVHLHHSHKNNMTIGAVHCYCNAVLWEHHGE